MPIPRDRDVEALLAYLEGRSTPQEAEAMERRLREDPDLVQSLAMQARMSMMLESTGREHARIRKVERASAAPARVDARLFANRTRRLRTTQSAPATWTLGLVAASIFIAIAILAVLLSSGPVPAARGKESSAAAQKKGAEEGLRDLEQERSRLLAKPVYSEKQPESITEEARKAALAELEDRKRRIEEDLRSAIARGGAAGTAEEKPPVPKSIPLPDVPPEKKPEEGTQASIAKVGRVSGEVFLIAAGSRKPVAPGQEILAGHSVETGSGTSLVEMSYPDQTRIELGAETIVKDLRIEGGKRVLIEKGTVRAEVKPQPKGQPMIFESAQGEAVVLGTTLKVFVAPDSKEGTTLEVEEGKVRFRNKISGKSVEVAGGHFSVAAPGVEFSSLALPTVLYAATFDDGRAPGWTFSPRYPWTLRSALASPVYTYGDPKAQRAELTAVLASKIWQDGVFDLDVRPEDFDTANLSSFLVFIRYRDPENTLWLEYMLTRGAWSVALLQLNGGVLTTIASAPAAAPLEIGRSYRFRLEAKDDEVRAFLDGKELLRGKTTVLAPGRLALCPMGSRMAFDNIRVTSVPLRPRLEKGR